MFTSEQQTPKYYHLSYKVVQTEFFCNCEPFCLLINNKHIRRRGREDESEKEKEEVASTPVRCITHS